MGPPLLIGAGLGAATSLAMGKNPFMGALLGGATGGAFGGAGGFGSGFGFGESGLLSGLKGVAPEAVSLGSGGYAQLAQNPLGSIGNGEIGSSLLTNSKGTPLNIMDKVGNYVSNLPSNAMDYVKNNPLTSAKTALDIATPTPEAPMQDRSTPVRQGNAGLLYAPNFNTNPSSNLDTDLQIGQTKDNAMGLLNALKSRIPLTDEEKAQLARLGQQY